MLWALCDRSRRPWLCYVHPLMDAGGYARSGCAWLCDYVGRVAVAHVANRKKKSRAVLLDWESHAVLNVVNLRMFVPHLKCNIMVRKHSHDVG